MNMYHGWVVGAEIGLKWPILDISSLKLAFLTSNWPLTPLKSNFLAVESLRHTLGHNSHGIVQENGL